MREVEIYTDGGCDPNPGPGGWGAILLDVKTGTKKELSGGEPKTTNNRMELTAVLKALETLKQACKVTVTTDSQYLSKAFTDGWLANWKRRGWKTAAKKLVKNKDLWLVLDEQIQRHSVIWKWTKGHAGHPENERCDEMVHEARARLFGK